MCINKKELMCRACESGVLRGPPQGPALGTKMAAIGSKTGFKGLYSVILTQQGHGPQRGRWPFLQPEVTDRIDGLADGLRHSAHRIEMRGDSMRKKRGPQPST